MMKKVRSTFGGSGKLVVVTDFDTACAGGVVSGRVYAFLEKPLASSTRLMLEFYGSETSHVQWAEPGGEHTLAIWQ
jgi:hypothetical protein